MKANKFFISLVLISSFNLPIAAFSLPEIAQPVLALKAMIDLAKLKEDFKKYYKNNLIAKKTSTPELLEDSSSLLNPNSTLATSAKTCDLALDTIALMASTYLLYYAFNSALQPKV
jgi:type II secretory pathway component PulC